MSEANRNRPPTEQLAALWESAQALPAAERQAFLDAAVAHDPALRSELAALQSNARDAESFFQRFAGVVEAGADALAEGDTLIGQSIGHYRIEARLGEGGMGVVYRAHDTHLNRTVALKFLPEHLNADRRAKERFLIEARAAAALDHTNICSIYEVGETENHRSFIAMAFYDGETLETQLKSGPLPWQRALDYATQIARGLSVAHERGIIHRDVKPANVIVTAGGVVKLLDFGIARMTDVTGVTGTGVTLGTMAYMSPEQVTGRPIDARTDLWSLGVLLYEMCTGVRPFRGKTATASLHAILNDPPPVPSKAQPELPRTVDVIVARLLEKDPAARYGDADELLGDLTRARTSAPPTPTMPKRGTRTALALLALLTGVALLWVLFARRESVVNLSLAVLPLESLSNGQGDEDFAATMHDQLIMELGTIKSVRVINRSGVLQYRDGPKSLPQIAGQLEVTYLLDGSTTLLGDSVRINVQLYDHSGKRLWGDSYVAAVANTLRLQAELSQLVAREIRATITPEERSRLADNPLIHPDALTLTAEGFRLLEKGGPLRAVEVDPDSARRLLSRASELFIQATVKDSTWALPWAYLAQTRHWDASTGEGLPNERTRGDSMYKLSIVAAQKAINLDSTEATAWAALGYVRRRFQWDWEGSRDAYIKASRFTPGAAEWGLAILHETTGDLDASVAAFERALAYDPRSQVLQIHYANALTCAGRVNDGLDTLPDPRPTWARFARANGLMRGKRYREAIDEFERLLDPDEIPPGNLAYAYLKAGDTVRARQLINERSTRAPEAETLVDHLVVGNTTRLMATLEEMIERKTLSPTVRCDPYFEDLIRIDRAKKRMEEGMNLKFHNEVAR